MFKHGKENNTSNQMRMRNGNIRQQRECLQGKPEKPSYIKISFKNHENMEGEKMTKQKNKIEVSFIELKGKNSSEKTYKVTRRVPDSKVSDTEFFNKLKDARKRFKEWKQ